MIESWQFSYFYINIYTAKKEVEISHLTGGKITLYTISTMVDSRVFEFYTNLSV